MKKTPTTSMLWTPGQETHQTRKDRRFTLGSFEVTEKVRHFDGRYSLYTVLADGVPVRQQISYPDIEDGWSGLRQTLPNVDGQITPAQVEKLELFLKAARGQRRKA